MALVPGSLQGATTLFYAGDGSNYWVDGAGQVAWSTTEGGSKDSVWSNGTTANAVFAQASGRTVYLSGAVVAGNVAFETTGYSLGPIDGTASLEATTLTSTVAAASLSVPLQLSGGSITLGGAGNLTVSGSISGTGVITKSGTGTVALTGNSTSVFSGEVPVLAGTLRVGANGALGATSNTVFLGDTTGSADASLLVSGGSYTIGQNVVARSGSSGILTFGSLLASGTALYTGAITLQQNAVLFQSTGGAANLSGAITGSGATLAKWGGGAATLSGGSAVSLGAVNVVEGTLTFSRTAAAELGAVQAGSGAIVRVAQTTPFSGTATQLVLSGGSLVLDTDVTQTFGALSTAGTSTIDFNTSATSSLEFAGTTSISGTLRIENYNYNTSSPAAGARLIIPGLDEVALARFTINGVSGASYLPSTDILVAVPEPSTYAIAAGALAYGVALLRRRARSRGDGG